MEFRMPTSKEEMYEILKDIFYYYRLQNNDYTDVDLPQIFLTRPQVYIYEENDLRSFVNVILNPNFLQRRIVAEKEYMDKTFQLLTEKDKLPSKKSQLIREIEVAYEKSIDTLDKTALKNGTGQSSIYADKKATLLKEKEQKIANVVAQITAEENSVQIRLDTLKNNYDAIKNNYDLLEEYEISAKLLEYDFKQKQYMYEMTKYNNTIESSLYNVSSTRDKLNANLKLKYAEMASKGFSKDQLVEMGYYNDAILCITSYYDTLSASDAYNQIKNDSNLIIYIDEYYQTLLYMYKIRAT